MSTKSGRHLNPWAQFLHVYAKKHRKIAVNPKGSSLTKNAMPFIQSASEVWRALSAEKKKEYLQIDRKPKIVYLKSRAERKYVFKSKSKELNNVLDQLRQISTDTINNEQHPNRVTAIKTNIRLWQERVLDTLFVEQIFH